MSRKVAPAISPEAGIVMSHATTISPATAHRTDLGRNADPAPIIDDEMTCVVEIGNPKSDVTYMIAADVLCDAKLWMGRTRYSPDPKVLMIRHPPVAIPSDMAAEQISTTQCGIAKPSPGGG